MTDERDLTVTRDLHPSIKGVLRFFETEHLPEGPIKTTAAQFRAFAAGLAYDIAPDPELTVALRKLLEAKDAAVRAVVVEEKAKRAAAGEPPTIVNPSEFRNVAPQPGPVAVERPGQYTS